MTPADSNKPSWTQNKDAERMQEIRTLLEERRLDSYHHEYMAFLLAQLDDAMERVKDLENTLYPDDLDPCACCEESCEVGCQCNPHTPTAAPKKCCGANARRPNDA